MSARLAPVSYYLQGAKLKITICFSLFKNPLGQFNANVKGLNFALSKHCDYYALGCVTFSKTSRYLGILKATVSRVFEDLKFKISEGSDQN